MTDEQERVYEAKIGLEILERSMRKQCFNAINLYVGVVALIFIISMIFGFLSLVIDIRPIWAIVPTVAFGIWLFKRTEDKL